MFPILACLAIALSKADTPKITHSVLIMDTAALSKTYKGKIPLGYVPEKIALTATRPASIVREPSYSGTPRYGFLTVGNGPRSRLNVVLDDKSLYIDANANGDLSDDHPIPWPPLGSMDILTVRSSYGNQNKEVSSGEYSFGFFGDQKNGIWFTNQSARVGIVDIAGKKHKALLVNGGPNAIFLQPPPTREHPGYAVMLLVDLFDRGDAGFRSGIYDIRAPFVIGRRRYRATASSDGADLTIEDIGARPSAPFLPGQRLLMAGQHVPHLTVDVPGTGRVSLASLNHKVVVLCWWATWSEPSMAWMPHLEAVWQRIRSRSDSAMLAICTLDKRKAFDKWMAHKKVHVTFPLGCVPTGKNNDELVRSRFGVTGLPTTLVIGKGGIVVEVIYGFEGDKDQRLEAALFEAGVDL